MADRRRAKKRKESEIDSEKDTANKLEYSVAKYLKGKLPVKKTVLLGHKVEYFIASKAIDCLLESKWASKGKDGSEPIFKSRQSVVQFMEQMLDHKIFHRAKKIIVAKKKKNDDDGTGTADEKDKKKNKKKKENDEKVKKDEKSNKNDKEDKKIIRKIKLDMHREQIFIDANEPYVWIYDPIPLKTWIIGAGVVFACVAVCLFPLWPKTLRNYCFYLSWIAGFFLLLIMVLVVLRVIIFSIVWLLTRGKHQIWIFPNLTEDVSFVQSFWPLYAYEYKGGDNEIDEKSKKKKKDKNSDDEMVDDGGDDAASLNDGDSLTASDDQQHKESSENSESESDNSENSSKVDSNGTQSDNGFEILEPEKEILS